MTLDSGLLFRGHPVYHAINTIWDNIDCSVMTEQSITLSHLQELAIATVYLRSSRRSTLAANLPIRSSVEEILDDVFLSAEHYFRFQVFIEQLSFDFISDSFAKAIYTTPVLVKSS